IAGLRNSGVNVVDLGMAPTPLMQFAAHTTALDSGVMLTASHNPAHYNGLKVVFRRAPLAEKQIAAIHTRIEKETLRRGRGSYETLEIRPRYVSEVQQRVRLLRPLKIVIDCGNAVAAGIAPDLFRVLGCDVIELFCEIDGGFPNHEPDPTRSENLAALQSAVINEKADLGLAFDGDGDRVGLVTDQGNIIPADRLLMLLVEGLADQYQGATIVYDVKCSRELGNLIEKLGLQPAMHKSGHSLMRQKIEQTAAPLGGEFSAHIFFKDRWFGFDDGMYAGARILELLTRQAGSCDEKFRTFPQSFATEEIRLEVCEQDKFSLMEKILEAAQGMTGNKLLVDGLRLEFDDGWGLVRASNTSAALLFRFEAATEPALQRIQSEFKALIQRADNSIELNI
ncbi:MAG: phosphomannomutase/phosphoglucomutase, partial [Pseudohongiellaceae bacterium]